MINRTRRKDIQDFCIRRSYTVETSFTPAQEELHIKKRYNEDYKFFEEKHVEDVKGLLKFLRYDEYKDVF